MKIKLLVCVLGIIVLFSSSVMAFDLKQLQIPKLMQKGNQPAQNALIHTWPISPLAGRNGTISPLVRHVNDGSTTSFTVTPESGYSASVGGTCGGTLSGTTYTTNPITANCTVNAEFIPGPRPPKMEVHAFGGIEFEDGVLDVANKLKAVEGLEFLALKGTSRKAKDIRVDLKDADLNNVGAKLTELITQTHNEFYDPKMISRAQFLVAHYVGKDGQNKNYIPGLTPVIVARPINIAGVPFELVIDFVSVPGLDLVKSENMITESKGLYTFPSVIESIRLYSSSPSLVEHSKEIQNILESKYLSIRSPYSYRSSTTDTSYRPGQVTGSFVGSNGIWLLVDMDPKGASCSLKYSLNGAPGFKEKVKEAYRKHLSNLDGMKVKESKDQAGKL